MGWGIYKFDPKRWNCIFSRKAAPSYSIFFASCGVILPLTVCALAYVTIWVTFAQSKRKLQRFPGAVVSGNPSMYEAKLTKNLFVVWLAFFICWIPMNTLLFVDPKEHLMLQGEEQDLSFVTPRQFRQPARASRPGKPPTGSTTRQTCDVRGSGQPGKMPARLFLRTQRRHRYPWQRRADSEERSGEGTGSC
ncbi:melatonin receptor type 1B-like [Aplysia californica]|uniref:Melatonin receptor type 1B-like n=1 Tax=Aplysia californica TaxID=6500 RepID=A0ABM1W0U3_APLCA|nr:melatonin receptor type 1B-like [Aplysia californica]